MLEKLPYKISPDLLKEVNQFDFVEFKSTINEPTSRFFYDPWKIKREYKDTVWDKILQTLPFPVGEARVIILKPTISYQIHADIDDRYHLNLAGEHCYLIDLENSELHKTETDMQWYVMDAGRRHTASNFGRIDRIQLVVRKLLEDTRLTDYVNVKLYPKNLSKEDAHFIFDNTISPWLNQANKKNIIQDFQFSPSLVTFKLNTSAVDSLKSILPENLYVETS
jgi:hypothetical protein